MPGTRGDKTRSFTMGRGGALPSDKGDKQEPYRTANDTTRADGGLSLQVKTYSNKREYGRAAVTHDKFYGKRVQKKGGSAWQRG